MALSGQLSDLSLAELIEFFCNQRKTGRLRVSYPRAPGFFYFQKGTMVDAKIGALNGVEAVYYSLTLENASFNFSAAFEPSRRTIHQPWAQVALEGLRRMDEGIAPSEAFPDGFDASFMEDVEGSNEVAVAGEDETEELIPLVKQVRKPLITSEMPLSLSVEHASGGRRSMMVYGVIAVVVLLSIAAVGFPAGWYSKKQAPNVAQPSTGSSGEQSLTNNASGNTTQQAPSQTGEASSVNPNDVSNVGPVNENGALAARREREARERDRLKATEGKTDPASAKPGASPASSTASDPTKKPEATKAKTTTVQVTYDEAGRVTQASGGDANALRIARQKRFPAGKPGSATVTIPVN